MFLVHLRSDTTDLGRGRPQTIPAPRFPPKRQVWARETATHGIGKSPPLDIFLFTFTRIQAIPPRFRPPRAILHPPHVIRVKIKTRGSQALTFQLYAQPQAPPFHPPGHPFPPHFLPPAASLHPPHLIPVENEQSGGGRTSRFGFLRNHHHHPVFTHQVTPSHRFRPSPASTCPP
jgi:hypothetical protein